VPIDDLVDVQADSSHLTSCPVPTSWGDLGIAHLAAQELPGGLGVLLIGWGAQPTEPMTALDLALHTVAAAIDRAVTQETLEDLTARVDNAQHLANMGDYDWHIASDTNRWSDQLFRIYGHEPQSFHPSYERFVSLVHEDDRERITALHQKAYGTGEPWQVIERIVRPDGEVRHLLTNGEVVMGPDSVPIRMRGTCIDITERVHAETEREAHAARVHEEQTRRQAALEINDSVVQGLTAALYALELDDTDAVRDYVRRTLDSARAIITDLVGPVEGPVGPGDLVRRSPSTLPD
jgi:PAS domain S-box-containing protein